MDDAATRSGRAGVRPAVAPAVRRPAVALTILGLIVLVVPAVRYAGDVRAGRLDRWVQSVVDRTPPGARDVAYVLDALGNPAGRAVAVLATTALCLIAGRRMLAVTAVVASLLVVLVTTGLKPVVDRTIHEGFLSYPSGHTAAVAGLGLVLGLLLADLLNAGPVTGTAVVLAGTALGGTLMAWSQIYLTAHYPTDTVGGVGSALVVVLATGLLIDRLLRDRV
jgi:membrane-associated phospholipid phosphatase